MTTLVLTNDFHFAVRPPVSRTDDYNGELFELLDQILKVAIHVKADAICIAGDILHGGALPYSTLNRLLEWAGAVRQRGIDLLAIPGNHDLKHDRYDSKDTLPVGALFLSGLFTDVSGREFTTGNVRVWGIPWPDGATPEALTRIENRVDAVLIHGFATIEGGTNYGEYCHKYDALAVAAPHVRLWHFGHDHSDHGVTTLKNGAKVVNIGALCRGALDHDNLTRTVKVAVATLPDGGAPAQVQQVALKVRPVREIFDLQLRARKAVESQQIAAFVADLQQGLARGQPVDFAAALAAMPMADHVRKLALEYVERAEGVVS